MPTDRLRRRVQDDPSSPLSEAIADASCDTTPGTSDAEIRAGELVTSAQDALSLSVTQIAAILGVARGTVYNWLKDIDVPRDDEKASRLRGLARWGKVWRARSGETIGRLLDAPIGEEQQSLFVLLHASTWDEPAITETMRALAENLQTRAEQRQRTAAAHPESVRPITPETVQLERLRLRGLGG